MSRLSEGDICVLDPTPLFTVTVESGGGRDPEIHLHAGGQGFWVARLTAGLGASVTLGCCLGGESGQVIETLIQSAGIGVERIDVSGPSGGYVHDRRSGDRVSIAEVPPPALGRHELDNFCETGLALAGRHTITVLCGPRVQDRRLTSAYAALVRNARELNALLVADVAAGALREMGPGVTWLKAAAHQIVEGGLADDEELASLRDAANLLREQGVANVVISRGEAPALVRTVDGHSLLHAPTFDTNEMRGSGDSMTGAIAYCLHAGVDELRMLAMVSAAGAANVTRHGLGSANLATIEALADSVEIERLD